MCNFKYIKSQYLYDFCQFSKQSNVKLTKNCSTLNGSRKSCSLIFTISFKVLNILTQQCNFGFKQSSPSLWTQKNNGRFTDCLFLLLLYENKKASLHSGNKKCLKQILYSQVHPFVYLPTLLMFKSKIYKYSTQFEKLRISTSFSTGFKKFF